MMNQIAAEDCAGLEAHRINAAAVAQYPHDIVDVVILDPVVLATCGNAGEAPDPAHGYARIGQIVDQVMRNYRSIGATGPDADPAEVQHTAAMDMIIGNAIVSGYLCGIVLELAHIHTIGSDVEDMIALDQIADATVPQRKSHASNVGQLAILHAAASCEFQTDGFVQTMPNPRSPVRERETRHGSTVFVSICHGSSLASFRRGSDRLNRSVATWVAVDDWDLLEFGQHRPQLLDQLRHAAMVLVDFLSECAAHGLNQGPAGEVDPEDDNVSVRHAVGGGDVLVHIDELRQRGEPPGRLVELVPAFADQSRMRCKPLAAGATTTGRAGNSCCEVRGPARGQRERRADGG